MKRRSALASGLLALASRASAQVARVCAPSNDQVCFRLNIPANTASSGDGDIFFQISGPSDYEWVALGQGSRMVNSNIFVIYVSESGNNVTLSPRRATSYTMPSFNGDAEVSLLEGSGVSDGMMVANVRCSNCRSWSGGTAEFTEDSGNWIYAYRPGGARNSDDQDASINQHSAAQGFSWDYSNAKGGDSVNPLLNADPSGTVSANPPTRTTNCIPRPTTGTFASGASTTKGSFPTTTASDSYPTNGPPYGGPYGSGRPSWWTGPPGSRPTGGAEKRQEVNYCDSDGEGDGDGNGGSDNSAFRPIGVGAMTRNRNILIAHGTLAALAFVILFPAGAITIRLASFPGVVWFHAAFQAFAYFVYIAAFGLGVYMANNLSLLNHHHPVIGIVIFIVLFFQPIFGMLHHSGFKKYGGRTFWSYAHLWLGRATITLGIINGGLGLRLADSHGRSSRSGIIAYSVVAALAWVAMVVASILGEKRRRKTGAASRDQPPKYEQSPVTGSPTSRGRTPRQATPPS